MDIFILGCVTLMMLLRFSRGRFTEHEKEPSFAEFVRWLILIDVNKSNEHWRPISVRCRWYFHFEKCFLLKTHFISLCQLSYSHILRIENFPQEWDIFIKEVGIRENIKLPWANKSKESSSRKYIQQLTKHEQNKLFQKYKADFLIFGYSVDDEYWVSFDNIIETTQYHAHSI